MTAQAVAALPLGRLPALPPAVLPRDRGLQRDELRLLVAHRRDGLLDHRRLRELPDVLRSGDILVVNTTRVIPAAVPARRDDGAELRVHLSTPVPGGWWLVELRRADGPGTLPFADGRAGEELSLPAGGAVRLLAPHASVPGDGVRLWLAELRLPAPLHAYVDEHGGPVRYSIHGQAADWPLSAAQTIFATTPGSVEPASAALGFTGKLVARLIAAGVELAPVLLHCGVASQDAGEPPYAERYEVAAPTARRINAARSTGGRVIAVGTTVARALETVADADGHVHPGHGWTEHVITPASGVRAIDGLLTGWHDPEASHLDLVTAVGGRALVERSYLEAAATGYVGHEFGDVHLIID